MSKRASSTKKAKPTHPIAPKASQRSASRRARLREGERRARVLAAAAFEGLAFLRQGVFEECNEQMAKLLGGRRREILGTPFLGCVAPNYRQAVADWLAQGRQGPHEFVARRRDGTEFAAEMQTRSAVARGGTKRVVAIRDITEHKRAVEAQRTSAHEVEWLMKSMASAFVVWETVFDAQGRLADIRFAYFNDAYARVSGLKLEAARGRTVREIWPDTEESWFQVYGEVARSGKSSSFEMYHVSTHGYYACTAYRPWDNTDRICVVFEDITQRKQAEEALRASESKMGEILRTSPCFLSISTLAEGRMMAVNDAAVRMLGFSREEILGRTSLEIGVWPTRDERERLIQLVREQGQIQNVEARMCRKSGEVFEVLISMTPLNLEGQSCLVTGVVDIAGLKKAEAAVRQSEALLRATLDSIDDGMLVISAAGAVSHHNARFLEIWSIPAEVAAAEDDRTLLAHAAPQVVDPDQFVADVQKIYLANVRNRDTVHFKDGRVIERFFFPVELPGAGVERLWLFRDVTARVRAEAALRDREARLASVIRAAPVGIGVVLDHVIREVNEAMSQITGLSREELVGQPVRILYASEEEFASVKERYARIFTQGVDTVETRWRRKEGEIVHVLLSAAPLNPERPERGITFVAVDITERKQAEVALRENEERLRLALAATQQGLFELDFQTGRFVVSEQFARMLGYELSEVELTQAWARARLHPEDLPLVRQAMLACLDGQRDDYRIETRMRSKGGDWRWILTVGKVVARGPDGKVLRILGTHTDTTERRRAEEALRESQASLVRAQAIARLGDWDFDLISGKGRSSAENYRLFSIDPATPAPQLDAFLEAIHPEDRPRLVEAQRRASETGDEMRLEFRSNPARGPLRHFASIVYGTSDATGRICHLAGTTQDITERKQAEAALQESEQKFRTLFEHMAEGVAIHEMVYNENGAAMDYRILDTNPAYGRHTGLAPEKVHGQLAGELYGTGSPPYLAEWAEVARTGKPLTFETYFAPMQKHFQISAVSPKPGFFATVFEDITERRQREQELRRKNEELERFTYTVSHDLKSPLITIKGFAGALLQDVAIGRLNRLQEDLKRIMSATDKMAALLNDLLELSRIGRIVNPPTDVQMDRLIQEVLELLAGPLSQRAVRVSVQPNLPTVQGDRRRLAEVFQNLIENAVRFLGDQPQPQIEIGVRGEGPDRVFFVRDNGMGIEPRYHETVFGLFNKLDARTPGTGIGLALVRRIIEVHGGKVWVESAGAGRGATFCFALPPNPPIRKESTR